MDQNPISAELDWSGRSPRSVRFDDVYFQIEDGLAETRHVFLAGCGLPQGWRGRSLFRVGELGFGSGLNMAALLDLWRRHRPSGEARLRLLSTEAYPMQVDDAARALSAFPELAEISAQLLEGWPGRRQGPHRLDFPDLNARLDVWIGPANRSLVEMDAQCDAWFLDGFAPSKNPDMWSQDVLDEVRRLSAPGCRLASFTVAGEVRRRLEGLGFSVAKCPGFGRKRQCLEARLPGTAEDVTRGEVAVIGGGVAGAALAVALSTEGFRSVLFERAKLGAGGSGNPAGLVAPRLDAGFGPAGRLHAEAFARAVAFYRCLAPNAILARGALQLEADAKDAARFDALSQWTGFEPGAMTRLSAAEASTRLGEASQVGGLYWRDALTVSPRDLLAGLAQGVEVRKRAVAQIVRSAAGWRLQDGRATLIGEFPQVFLAPGAQARALKGDVDFQGLGIETTRGQVSYLSLKARISAATWGGYLLPTRKGFLFGATHNRDRQDATATLADDLENLQTLARGRPSLAADLSQSLNTRPLSHRASLRAFVRDHMPIAGELAPGLFLLCGLGGRGLSLAPWLAEQIAAQAAEAPRPLALDLKARVSPLRPNLTPRPAS